MNGLGILSYYTNGSPKKIVDLKIEIFKMFEIAFNFPMNYIFPCEFLVIEIISKKMKISFPMLVMKFSGFRRPVPKISYDSK